MQDKQRTPFNVGRPIELMGFQLHEADPLAQGLAARSSLLLGELSELSRSVQAVRSVKLRFQ